MSYRVKGVVCGICGSPIYYTTFKECIEVYCDNINCEFKAIFKRIDKVIIKQIQ